jgi:hypothetical protein
LNPELPARRGGQKPREVRKKKPTEGLTKGRSSAKAPIIVLNVFPEILLRDSTRILQQMPARLFPKKGDIVKP